MSRRSLPWFAWAGGCVALLVLGVVAGSLVRAPWQDAVAHAERPVIATATVEEGQLSAEVPAATGTFSSGQELAISPREAADRAVATVTRHHVEPGKVVRGGQPVVDVSGRPVFVLNLPFNLYRDLKLGDSGEDVVAVQDALRRCGHYSGESDGVFGTATASGVRSMYRAAGLSLPAPPDAVSAGANEARERLAEYRRSGGIPGSGIDAKELARLERESAQASGLAGPRLSMAEVFAIPADEVTVVSLSPVGTDLTGEVTAVGTVRFGDPRVSARVSVPQAPSYPAEAKVEVSSGDSAAPATGAITAVSEFRDADDANPMPGYDITVELDEAPSWPDASTVRIVPHGSGEARAGLIVPLSALRESGGTTYVLVLGAQADGSDARRIEVTTELVAEDRALVTGDLSAGDVLVIAGIADP